MTEPPDHPITADQRLRVLEAGHRHMVNQMVEMTAGMQAVQQGMATGGKRMTGIETELSKNSTVTAEVRDILAVTKAGLRVLGGIGTLVRWAGYIAAAFASMYALYYTLTHGGRMPGKD